MNINPAPSPRDGSAGGGSERGGIARRVEAAAKMSAPAPKGKGIVMLILAVVVMGALIWDFSGRSAASRAVERNSDDGKRPVAP